MSCWFQVGELVASAGALQPENGCKRWLLSFEVDTRLHPCILASDFSTRYSRGQGLFTRLHWTN